MVIKTNDPEKPFSPGHPAIANITALPSNTNLVTVVTRLNEVITKLNTLLDHLRSCGLIQQ